MKTNGYTTFVSKETCRIRVVVQALDTATPVGALKPATKAAARCLATMAAQGSEGLGALSSAGAFARLLPLMRCGEAAGQADGDVGYVALAATVLREALADAATSGEAEAVLERLGALLPSKPDLLCAPDARFVMRVVDYLTPLNDRGPKAVKAATALTRLPTLIPAMLHALSANSWALMRQLAYLACYALAGYTEAPEAMAAVYSLGGLQLLVGAMDGAGPKETRYILTPLCGFSLQAADTYRDALLDAGFLERAAKIFAAGPAYPGYLHALCVTQLACGYASSAQRDAFGRSQLVRTALQWLNTGAVDPDMLEPGSDKSRHLTLAALFAQRLPEACEAVQRVVAELRSDDAAALEAATAALWCICSHRSEGAVVALEQHAADSLATLLADPARRGCHEAALQCLHAMACVAPAQVACTARACAAHVYGELGKHVHAKGSGRVLAAIASASPRAVATIKATVQRIFEESDVENESFAIATVETLQVCFIHSVFALRQPTRCSLHFTTFLPVAGDV
jgi:hypothetical protein